MAKRIDKKVFKHAAGKCRICGEPNYAVLQVHRINAGANGGKYSRENSVSLCANCHQKVHDEQIVIDRYYTGSSGTKLRIIEDGIERFV